MKYIKNLEDQILTEGLADNAAEVSGLDSDVINKAINKLDFAAYLELGNAVQIEDADRIREILNIDDVVPAEPIEEIDLEEDDEHPEDQFPHDPTMLCSLCGSRGYDKYGNTCTACGGQGRLTLDGEYITGDENGYNLTLDDLREADNPSAPAATPAATAVTPPSAGSSIDNLAKPVDTANKDNEDMVQSRKEIEDLQIGDEIEVADIDGQPAVGRVRTVNGPGNTIVITGKGNEEHMIRKDSILSTPLLPVQEKQQSRLDKTKLGKKNKRAERVEQKKQKDVHEELYTGADARDAKLAALAIEEFGPIGFKTHPNWPAGTVLISNGDKRKATRAFLKQSGWVKEYPGEKRDSWMINPNKEFKVALDYDRIRTFISTLPDWGDKDPTESMELPNLDEMKANFEKALNEVAPPGMEDWIMKRKPEFKKRYGKKWQEVLYATAWKQHNNESIEEGEKTKRGPCDHCSGTGKDDGIGNPCIMCAGSGYRDYEDHGIEEGKLRKTGSAKTRTAIIVANAAIKVAHWFKQENADLDPNDVDDAISLKTAQEDIQTFIKISKLIRAGKSKAAAKIFDNLDSIIEEELQSVLSDTTLRMIDKFIKTHGGDGFYRINISNESIEEGLQFFVEPLAGGKFEVRNDRGDHHDVYDSGEEAVRVAKELNDQYGYDDKKIAKLKDNLNEDWGSSDWYYAIESFLDDLDSYDTVAEAAYETAVHYNDDRRFMNDPWSHFSPRDLVWMAMQHRRIPEPLESEAQAILNDEYTGSLQHEMNNEDKDIARIKELAGINEVKSGNFNSKMIGQRVKIIAVDSVGNNHIGEEGVIKRASREHTFSQMVPFVIEYGVTLDGGERISIRRERVRKIKQITEDSADKHQKKIAIDTVKNPNKALLGGPSVKEAENTLRNKFGYTDKQIAKLKETASGGATGAGAIASSPVAMNGMQSRNTSIYGQTKLRKKPEPKKRPTSEEKEDGIGRGKKD